MNAQRKRLLAPKVHAAFERENSLSGEAAQALDTARAIVAGVNNYQLSGEEIEWFVAEQILAVRVHERRENMRREALAVASALSGVKGTLSTQIQAQIDAASRRAEGS